MTLILTPAVTTKLYKYIFCLIIIFHEIITFQGKMLFSNENIYIQLVLKMKLNYGCLENSEHKTSVELFKRLNIFKII